MKKYDKDNLYEKIVSDPVVRREIVRKSHKAFFVMYLNHYLKHDFAFFHKEMFYLTQKYDHKLNVVMAFRGCGKSTILNLSNVLWSILGHHQKKFILIIGNTRVQAQGHFQNIKHELETNELLIEDLGPFKESQSVWGEYTIEIPSLDAKIMCLSSNQNIRGLRHHSHRPDLIICDDLEDSVSVQDKNKRKQLFDWFANEVMEIGDEKTNIVVLGNLPHEDCLMVRLYKLINKGQINGQYFVYPILDDDNKILWPAKYPNAEAIIKLRDSLPKPNQYEFVSVWERDYLLNISYVRQVGNHQNKKKENKPIILGGKTKKSFTITVPKWAWGVVWDFEDEYFENLSDEEGW